MLAAVLVAGAGALAAAGSPAADPVALTLNHECPFPVIGTKVVPVVVESDLPSHTVIGETVEEPPLVVGLRFSAEDTLRLQLAEMATIGGAIGLDLTIATPTAPHQVSVPIQLATTRVPASGPFTVPGYGLLPSVTFDTPGQTWFTVDSTSLDLLLAAPSLGEFQSSCVAAPGQDTLLATVTTVGVDQPVSLTVDQDCAFPLVGWQLAPITVESDIPAVTQPGGVVGPLPFAVRIGMSETMTEAFRLLGVIDIWGSARLALTVETPTGTVPVEVPIVLDRTRVPHSGEFSLVGTGWSPRLALTAPGENRFHVAGADLDLRVAGPHPGPLDPTHIPCDLRPGQDTLLATVTTPPTAPPPPAQVRAVGTTHDSVTLEWTPPTGEHGITGYTIAAGGLVSEVEGVGATGGTLRGLTADTEHTLEVRSHDVAGTRSEPVTVTARTEKAKARLTFDLVGTAAIKAARTTVGLNGTVEATLDPRTNAFTADLALRPSTAKVRVLGVLPAEADVVFAPATSTGELAGGVLSARATLGVTLPRVTLLGFPLSTEPDCGTTVDIAMSGEFDPIAGVALAGDFTVPPVTGCGRFTDLISYYVEGPDNTAEITLTL